MPDAYALDISLLHRVSLSEREPYDEIIQSYDARILCDPGELDAIDEVIAGTFRFYVANIAMAANMGIDIVDVADSKDSDMEGYCCALFEPGTASHLREEVLEQFDVTTGSRLLILHLAKVLPKHRGRNVALVAAHRIIEQFGDGMVIVMPQPLQHRDGHRDEKAMRYDSLEARPALALKQLTAYWQRLGFEPIGDTKYLGLSTDDVLPVPKLKTPQDTKARPRKAPTKKGARR